MGKLSLQLKSELEMLELFENISPDLDEQEKAEFLDGLVEANTSSLEAISRTMNFIDFLDSQVARADAVKKRADDQKKFYQNIQSKIKWSIKNYLEQKGEKSVQTGDYRLTLAESVSTIVDDESALPDEMVDVVVTRKPKKLEIKKAIKSGVQVPGAHLETHKNLRVK